ncbi:uncharacterized protein LOC100569370 isoform X1 [Acyrthosiphon pisum]|uniref:Uncharacterized protein n=1 Tax=Acyrthosiphon pisum TaxID=7029 RepID=A0A8R2NN74_ACYPI|nr:uncharacterized protein LOC100569370 isoform X1 [Acyrthosiphon pisum]
MLVTLTGDTDCRRFISGGILPPGILGVQLCYQNLRPRILVSIVKHIESSIVQRGRKHILRRTTHPTHTGTSGTMLIIFFRFQSKRCLYLVVLIILTAIVSFLVLYPESHATDHKIDDPDFQVPLQSNIPAGLYNEVGIVSNGGPCSQIGV